MGASKELKMVSKKLYDDGTHEWIVFGRDPSKPNSVIDTNEYLIISSGQAMMMDPGGSEIFPAVLSEVSRLVDIKQIKQYLCSHQDPDIMSSLPLWMSLTPEAKIYVSWLWGGFIAHFGSSYVNQFISVPDSGLDIKLGSTTLQLIPAHFLHSSGNFHLYDPKAKILFSGDVGSAIVPENYPFFVEDFMSHISLMEPFHMRWMPSNEAKNKWIRHIRKLNVEMICPQHGAIMRGVQVKLFLDWFEALEVGKTKE